MGIYDGVRHLAHYSGLHGFLTADLLAYKGLTLEFLSTLSVERVHTKHPHKLKFQLGGVARVLAVARLQLMFAPGNEGKLYLRDRNWKPGDMWDEITEPSVERVAYYNPTMARANSIRNPTFRYFHRLLTQTILGRIECGKVQSHDLYIMKAAVSQEKLWGAGFLADHFESQSELTGNVQICCGAFITPIAQHYKLDIIEDPMSRDIYLDRSSLYGQTFLKKHNSFLLWIIYERARKRFFKLPNTPFTNITGCENEEMRIANWRLSSPGHTLYMLQENHIGHVDDSDEEVHYEAGSVATGPYPNYDARFDSIDGHLARLDTKVTNIYNQQEEMLRMMRQWDSSFRPPSSS